MSDKHQPHLKKHEAEQKKTHPDHGQVGQAQREHHQEAKSESEYRANKSALAKRDKHPHELECHERAKAKVTHSVDHKSGTEFKYDAAGRVTEARFKDGRHEKVHYASHGESPSSLEIYNQTHKLVASLSADAHHKLALDQRSGAIEVTSFAKHPGREHHTVTRYREDGGITATHFDHRGRKYAMEESETDGRGQSHVTRRHAFQYENNDGKVTELVSDAHGRVTDKFAFANETALNRNHATLHEKIIHSYDTAVGITREHHQVYDLTVQGRPALVSVTDKQYSAKTGLTTVDTALASGPKQHVVLSAEGLPVELTYNDRAQALRAKFDASGHLESLTNHGQIVPDDHAGLLGHAVRLAVAEAREIEPLKRDLPLPKTEFTGTLTALGQRGERYSVVNGDLFDTHGKFTAHLNKDGMLEFADSKRSPEFIGTAFNNNFVLRGTENGHSRLIVCNDEYKLTSGSVSVEQNGREVTYQARLGMLIDVNGNQLGCIAPPHVRGSVSEGGKILVTANGAPAEIDLQKCNGLKYELHVLDNAGRSMHESDIRGRVGDAQCKQSADANAGQAAEQVLAQAQHPTIKLPKLTQDALSDVAGRLRIGDHVYEIRQGKLYEEAKSTSASKVREAGKLNPDYSVSFHDGATVSLANQYRVLLDLQIGEHGGHHRIVGLGPARNTDSFGFTNGGLVDSRELYSQALDAQKQALVGNADYFKSRPYSTGWLANAGTSGAVENTMVNLEESIGRDAANLKHRMDRLFADGFDTRKVSSNRLDGHIDIAQLMLKNMGAAAVDANSLAAEGKHVQKLTNDAAVMAAITVATAGIGTGANLIANSAKLGNLARAGLMAAEVTTGATTGGVISAYGRMSDCTDNSRNFRAGLVEGATMSGGTIGTRLFAQLNEATLVQRVAFRVADSAAQSGGFAEASNIRYNTDEAMTPHNLLVGTGAMLVGHLVGAGASTVTRRLGDATADETSLFLTRLNRAGNPEAAIKVGGIAEHSFADQTVTNAANAYGNGASSEVFSAIQQERERLARERGVSPDTIADRDLDYGRVLQHVNEAGVAAALAAPFVTAGTHAVGRIAQHLDPPTASLLRNLAESGMTPEQLAQHLRQESERQTEQRSAARLQELANIIAGDERVFKGGGESGEHARGTEFSGDESLNQARELLLSEGLLNPRDTVEETKAKLSMMAHHFKGPDAEAPIDVAKDLYRFAMEADQANFDMTTIDFNKAEIQNKAGFLHKTQELIDAGALHKYDVASINLAGFKAVNDSLGHHAGDSVLTEASKGLKNTALEGVHFFNLGGNDYAAYIPKGSEAQVRQAIARSSDGLAQRSGLPADCPELSYSMKEKLLATTDGAGAPRTAQEMLNAVFGMQGHQPHLDVQVSNISDEAQTLGATARDRAKVAREQLMQPNSVSAVIRALAEKCVNSSKNTWVYNARENALAEALPVDQLQLLRSMARIEAQRLSAAYELESGTGLRAKETYEHELMTRSRNGDLSGVIVADVRGFGRLNGQTLSDVLALHAGRAVGDAGIRAVADAMRDAVLAGGRHAGIDAETQKQLMDSMARPGGDELALVLPKNLTHEQQQLLLKEVNSIRIAVRVEPSQHGSPASVHVRRLAPGDKLSPSEMDIAVAAGLARANEAESADGISASRLQALGDARSEHIKQLGKQFRLSAAYELDAAKEVAKHLNAGNLQSAYGALPEEIDPMADPSRNPMRKILDQVKSGTLTAADAGGVLADRIAFSESHPELSGYVQIARMGIVTFPQSFETFAAKDVAFQKHVASESGRDEVLTINAKEYRDERDNLIAVMSADGKTVLGGRLMQMHHEAVDAFKAGDYGLYREKVKAADQLQYQVAESGKDGISAGTKIYRWMDDGGEIHESISARTGQDNSYYVDAIKAISIQCEKMKLPTTGRIELDLQIDPSKTGYYQLSPDGSPLLAPERSRVKVDVVGHPTVRAVSLPDGDVPIWGVRRDALQKLTGDLEKGDQIVAVGGERPVYLNDHTGMRIDVGLPSNELELKGELLGRGEEGVVFYDTAAGTVTKAYTTLPRDPVDIATTYERLNRIGIAVPRIDKFGWLRSDSAGKKIAAITMEKIDGPSLGEILEHPEVISKSDLELVKAQMHDIRQSLAGHRLGIDWGPDNFRFDLRRKEVVLVDPGWTSLGGPRTTGDGMISALDNIS